jgi:uncharacterized protein YhaN
MWVERIEIGGFGRLHDLQLELGEGLNVVTGLNEAGKSTLHQAIATGLFGVFASTDRRKEHEAERRRERYAPWDGGAYGLGVILRRASAPAVRIDWELGGRTSFRASDALTGADCTAALRGAGDGVLRSGLHGISRAVFERALVVRQGELAAIADDEGAVARALEEALASSERNASAARAVEILAGQRDALGTARAHKRPLPLARAEAHHAAEALRDAEQAREELEGAARAARTAEGEAAKAEGELRAARTGARGRRLAELTDWQQRVADLERRLGELDRRRTALGDAGSLEPAAVSELERAVEQRGEASSRAERARRAADGAEPALADAEGRLRELDETAAAHEAYRSGPGAAELAEVEAAAGRLAALQAEEPGGSRRPSGTLAGGGLALVLAIAAAVAGSILAAAILVVVAAAGIALGVHWLMIERDRSRARERAGAGDETRLRSLLAAAGIDAADPAAVERFRHAARGRTVLEEAEARAVGLRGQVQELGRERAESRRLDGELVESERRVRAAYLALGVDPSDETAAAIAVDTRRERAATRVQLDDLHRQLAAEHSGLVAGRDPQALSTELMELRAAGVEPADAGASAVDERAIADRAHEARARAAGAQAQLDTLASGLADTSELEERLAVAQDRAERLERAHEVLSIAADALAEAAAETYRDVAPHLNRALSDALDRATDGRYREARVAPDLTVTVHGPERAAPVAIDDLSFGTRELVHLVQRLELAKLLGGDDPAPLLLDDVLGHTDPRRRQALAALIADAAAERQVIVLATTPEAADALLAAAPDATFVDLSSTTPAAPASLF